MAEEKTALLVEDDDIKYRVISAMLGRRLPHLSVIRAETAVAASRAMARHRIDAVITDAVFPFTTGTREIHAYPVIVNEAVRRGLPIVVISGLNRPEEYDGHWIVFGRDCSMRELCALLETMLERGGERSDETGDDTGDNDSHGEAE